ncbi:putative oxidoreductase [uncultured Pleomorphomonas sp.]|uniref:Probable oxidoreductase n=2 Tax=uncultured Pleomorphomonas sp. TaxID=442121 RepID=A0A212KXV2_9HYPH|nr:putative oxidoreductase [uncultured Pleomorphomonas sp.]
MDNPIKVGVSPAQITARRNGSENWEPFMPSVQRPLPSGFGRTTTAEEALAGTDLSGKLAVVTGGYAGIGRETVRVLSGAGASIVVPARNVEKARDALRAMPQVEIHHMDLADPSSIDDFARDFVASGRPLDLLINNAGIMATPLAHNARGYESQFATNHLGHFQLVARLWPSLERSGQARVVVLSSGAHRFSDVDFDDPNYHRRVYDKFMAYGQSKTANALFALGLDIRGEAYGVRAFSVHPGSIATELTRYVPLEDLQAMGFRDENGDVTPHIAALYKTVEQGAATTVWCAASSQLDGLGGVYCEDCDIAQPMPADTTELFGVLPWAMDPERADRLWLLSENLTGIKFLGG